MAGRKRLTFRRLDKNGIPLREVIAVHEQFARSKQAIRGNVGDGYLLAFNPVYRAVRKEFLARGFRFVRAEKIPLAARYFAFPLMSLDDAIDAGRAPHHDNFVWLKELERCAPRTFTLTELKRSELQFNYLFHESAHFIAHDLLFAGRSIRQIPKNRAGLLRILMGEAFANTTECVSVVFAEGEIGAYFLDANCHFRANRKEAKVLRAAVKRLGLEKTARVLFAAFLYSNFLFERVGARELGRIRAFAEVEPRFPLRELARIGLQLNVQFRTTTTQLHLIKQGFPANLGALLRFDPVAALLKEPVLLGQARALAGILCREQG